MTNGSWRLHWCLVLPLLILVGCGGDPAVWTASIPAPPDVQSVLGSDQALPPRETRPLLAGVAKVDATPPVGVPLAGYGKLQRRSLIPDLNPFDYNYYFKASTGVRDPIYVKALAISDGPTSVAILTTDTVAVDGALVEEAHARAVRRGVVLPLENLLVCAAHTHSGPAAMSSKILWQFAALDAESRAIRDPFIDRMADALVAAFGSLRPARLGVGSGDLPGITVNRRAPHSPRIEPDSVDSELGVIRVDEFDGRPMAVLWNFAIHGTVLDANNLLLSADVMGACSALVEQSLGCVSLFANGVEGDVSHHFQGEAGLAEVGPVLADKVLSVHREVTTADTIQLDSRSRTHDFGPGRFHLNPQFVSMAAPDADCAGCPLTVRYIPGFNWPLLDSWIETSLRFQAIRLNDCVIAGVPGEPITELGLQIKSDGRALGYGSVFVFGLTNGYMGYIATEPEFWWGSYEAQATFWGPGTAATVRQACFEEMLAVR